MRTFFALFLICSFTFASNGESDSLRVYNSQDSIVIIANRYSASLKNTANSYQIIPGKILEVISSHSVLEAVDLLSPSAFVLDKKVMGYGVGTASAGALNIRGMGGQPNTGVLVLLNGHPDVMGIFGHPLPDVYGNSGIYQAEVLTGASSTMFGSHAMGGVVNLTTQPLFEQTIKSKIETGRFNTQRLAISVARRWNKNGFFASYGLTQSDGHLKQTGFKSRHYQAGWQYQINTNWNLSLQGRYVPYSFDDPSRGATDKLNIHAFGKIRRGTGELILTNKGRRLTGSTQVYTNFGRHEFYDGFQANDFTYGLSGYQHFIFNEKLQFAGGMDVMRFGGKAKNAFAFLPNGQPVVNSDLHQMDSFGGYMAAFYSPFRMLHLKGGIRYQYNSLALSTFSPMFGAALTPYPRFKLFASYGNGFRTPTLMELYLFPSANAQLKNESVNNYESGVEYTWSSRLSWRAAVFYNQIENRIQAVRINPPTPAMKFLNSGKAEQWGWETQISYRFAIPAYIRLSYAFLEADRLTAFNPRHQLKYMFAYNKTRIGFYLYGKFIQKLYAANDNRQPLADYHVLNGSLRLGKKDLNLYLRVLNILDRAYDVLPGYPAPGRQMRIGLNFNY